MQESMSDPSNALKSFQEHFSLGYIPLQSCELHPDVFVFADTINGQIRHSYVKLENNIVTSFVNFILVSSIKKIPCFQVGYAVPKEFRNQGRAKEILKMAIDEMRHGFKLAGVKFFYIEAIVGSENKWSRRVAEQIISAKPISIVDKYSHSPALQYLLLIE